MLAGLQLGKGLVNGCSFLHELKSKFLQSLFVEKVLRVKNMLKQLNDVAPGAQQCQYSSFYN